MAIVVKQGYSNVVVLTEEEVELINNLQQEQIRNPRKAVVNGEGAFVLDALNKLGYTELGGYYWSVYCGGFYKFSDDSVLKLMTKLHEIDSTVTMPDWGYSGT